VTVHEVLKAMLIGIVLACYAVEGLNRMSCSPAVGTGPRDRGSSGQVSLLLHDSCACGLKGTT
jgi:hypothetical protein